MNLLDPVPKLVGISSNLSININNNPFTLGRGLNCDYVVTNQTVSRLHCQLEKLGDYWFLRDKSTNGTFLNDVLIKGTLSPYLKDQDVIQLSDDCKYRFQCSDNITDEQLCQIADSLIQTIKDVPYTTVSNGLDKIFPSEKSVATGEQPNKKIKVAVNSTGNNIIDLTNESAQSSSSLHEPSIIDLCDSYILPSTSNKDEVKISDAKDEPETRSEIPSTSTSATRVEIESSQLDQATNENQEFLCAICSELFVKATTLNCSHTFCKYCIETWRKKQNFCPICRTKITSQVVTLVLDNFIEKIIQNSSKKVQDNRKELLEERQKDNQIDKNAKDLSTVYLDYSTDYSTDTEDDDDDDYDIGMNDNWDQIRIPYYGGYGNCFTCGRRGHWSRGCPFR
ncbi:uncharacterized protein LOC130902102 isoform X1 [Diorhabda carinulata]|uniref:uncharacterized protein LOC130902102 isoform X1 n=1 Tax=Diorhabda carinulata TaxID=1163345 RepID=UPI0025A10084|nr:uncharacterized protein LOC130902102 isoform X1 [Diorhabda carinulata]